MGVPNESFPPQSCLTLSPPGGLYNLPAPTSVPRFTQAGSMLLLPILLAASCWSRGDTQAVPVQTLVTRTQAEGRSASMACQLTKEDTVHWYKQLPGEPPKRILYVSGQTPVFDDSSDRQKYQVRKRASEPLYTLQINNVNQRDAGTYYCAYWYSYQGITALDGPR